MTNDAPAARGYNFPASLGGRFSAIFTSAIPIAKIEAQLLCAGPLDKDCRTRAAGGWGRPGFPARLQGATCARPEPNLWTGRGKASRATRHSIEATLSARNLLKFLGSGDFFPYPFTARFSPFVRFGGPLAALRLGLTPPKVIG